MDNLYREEVQPAAAQQQRRRTKAAAPEKDPPTEAAPLVPIALTGEALLVAQRWQEYQQSRESAEAHTIACRECVPLVAGYCQEALALLAAKESALRLFLEAAGNIRPAALPPDGPCQICHQAEWWLSREGAIFCGICHPPAPGAASWRLAPPRSPLWTEAGWEKP